MGCGPEGSCSGAPATSSARLRVWRLTGEQEREQGTAQSPARCARLPAPLGSARRHAAGRHEALLWGTRPLEAVFMDLFIARTRPPELHRGVALTPCISVAIKMAAKTPARRGCCLELVAVVPPLPARGHASHGSERAGRRVLCPGGGGGPGPEGGTQVLKGQGEQPQPPARGRAAAPEGLEGCLRPRCSPAL